MRLHSSECQSASLQYSDFDNPTPTTPQTFKRFATLPNEILIFKNYINIL